MYVELAEDFKGTSFGEEASEILGKCVHCGFCTATCPTYQLLGDELDGPRGRIYLVKQLLETAEASETTRLIWIDALPVDPARRLVLLG